MASQAPPGWREKILHATLTVGGTAFSGADVLPEEYNRPHGFHIQLNLDDVAAAEDMFARLADGGEETVPLAETFWAQRFGMVVDRFGIPWALNCGDRQAA